MLPGIRDRFQAPVFMKGAVCFSAKLPIFRQLKMVINVYEPALNVNIVLMRQGRCNVHHFVLGMNEIGEASESLLMQ